MHFVFYDCETTGKDARHDRITRFSWIKTDENLNPLGSYESIDIEVPDDVLLDPFSLRKNGIDALKQGFLERDFADRIMDIFTPHTIAVGYNNVGFDDNFVRHALWRSLQDPYEWVWKTGRGRWDVLSLARLAHSFEAPMEWPEIGPTPENLLEIARLNDLPLVEGFESVSATLELAKLVMNQSNTLFNWSLTHRHKTSLDFVSFKTRKPFVLIEDEARVLVAFAPGDYPDNILAYDLSVEPSQFEDLDYEHIKEWLFDPKGIPLPIHVVEKNRVPAVATWFPKQFDETEIERHRDAVFAMPKFLRMVHDAFQEREKEFGLEIEDRLYERFAPAADKLLMVQIVINAIAGNYDGEYEFQDDRLEALWVDFRARYQPSVLLPEQVKAFYTRRFMAQIESFRASCYEYVELYGEDEVFDKAMQSFTTLQDKIS